MALIRFRVGVVVLAAVTTMLVMLSTAAAGRTSWRTEAPMPTPRDGLAVVASGDRIYAIGGQTASGSSAVVEEFAAKDSRWTTRASMTLARDQAGAAVLPDGRIVVAGGENNVLGTVLASVEILNPSTNTWTTAADMPTARAEPVLAQVDGAVYAIGGYNQCQLGTVERYDPVQNSWSARSPMPTPRRGAAGVALPDGHIIVAGGFLNCGNPTTGPVATVEAYDPATDTWTSLAPMPDARAFVTAALGSDGHVYVIGGYREPNYLGTVEVYDPRLNSWTTTASLPTARADLGAAAVKKRIYAIGGEIQGGQTGADESLKT